MQYYRLQSFPIKDTGQSRLSIDTWADYLRGKNTRDKALFDAFVQWRMEQDPEGTAAALRAYREELGVVAPDEPPPADTTTGANEGATQVAESDSEPAEDSGVPSESEEETELPPLVRPMTVTPPRMMRSLQRGTPVLTDTYSAARLRQREHVRERVAREPVQSAGVARLLERLDESSLMNKRTYIKLTAASVLGVTIEDWELQAMDDHTVDRVHEAVRRAKAHTDQLSMGTAIIAFCLRCMDSLLQYYGVHMFEGLGTDVPSDAFRTTSEWLGARAGGTDLPFMDVGMYVANFTYEKHKPGRK